MKSSGVDNAKEGKSMKPELKFGRPVLAWNNRECDAIKAKYVYGCKDGHIILIQGAIEHRFHVKPDLDAPPMNGDEVIGEYIGSTIGSPVTGQYVGLDRNGQHVIDNRSHGLVRCVSVRHPQPSKRERVEEFLNSYYYPCNAEKIADQIDKIYTEES